MELTRISTESQTIARKMKNKRREVVEVFPCVEQEELKVRKVNSVRSQPELLKLLKYTLIASWLFLLLFFLLNSLAISFKIDLRFVSLHNHISEDFDAIGIFDFASPIDKSDAEGKTIQISSDAEADPYLAVDLSQKLAPSKETKKVTTAQDIDLACKEVACVEKCFTKLSYKCLKSDSCRKRKARECRLSCRKDRCAKRCDLEPQFGYVEREMKLDTCKEECHGGNKCAGQCEIRFMPCKTKCRTMMAKKFSCDIQARDPLELYEQKMLGKKAGNLKGSSEKENTEDLEEDFEESENPDSYANSVDEAELLNDDDLGGEEEEEATDKITEADVSMDI